MRTSIRTIGILVMTLAMALPSAAQNRYTPRYAGAGQYHRPYSSNYYAFNDKYVGLRVGFNIATMGFHGPTVSACDFTGLNFGIVGGTELTTEYPLYFESGLLVSAKGMTVHPGNGYGKSAMNLTYFEVPFVVKYKIDTGTDHLTIDPFFGGFASVGFMGKTKDFTTREKLNSFDSKLFRNLDAGLRFGCGVSYDMLYLEAAYDLGLANVARDKFMYYGYDNFDDKLRTRAFSLTFGVNF